MLRPANHALRHRKSETATTVAVLAFALLIPGICALIAAFIGDAAHSYLQAYRPIVYLSADVEQDEATTLAGELQSWPDVAEAKLRSPDEAFAQIESRLGADEVAKLGVSAHMLPYSVVLEPATPVVGHLDLIARVSGLEARMEVESVDLPSPQAARTLSFGRWVLILGAVLVVVLVVTAVGQVRAHLVRLAADRATERELLEIFGAPPAKLRRPTLVRGGTLGIWAGGIAFAGLFVLLLLWQDARPAILGVEHAASGWAWLATTSPILLGPLAGLLAGWFANRRLRARESRDELEIRSLLG